MPPPGSEPEHQNPADHRGEPDHQQRALGHPGRPVQHADHEHGSDYPDGQVNRLEDGELLQGPGEPLPEEEEEDAVVVVLVDVEDEDRDQAEQDRAVEAGAGFEDDADHVPDVGGGEDVRQGVAIRTDLGPLNVDRLGYQEERPESDERHDGAAAREHPDVPHRVEDVRTQEGAQQGPQRDAGLQDAHPSTQPPNIV